MYIETASVIQFLEAVIYFSGSYGYMMYQDSTVAILGEDINCLQNVWEHFNSLRCWLEDRDNINTTPDLMYF